jgi:hypothetical protein
MPPLRVKTWLKARGTDSVAMAATFQLLDLNSQAVAMQRLVLIAVRKRGG